MCGRAEWEEEEEGSSPNEGTLNLGITTLLPPHPSQHISVQHNQKSAFNSVHIAANLYIIRWYLSEGFSIWSLSCWSFIDLQYQYQYHPFKVAKLCLCSGLGQRRWREQPAALLLRWAAWRRLRSVPNWARHWTGGHLNTHLTWSLIWRKWPDLIERSPQRQVSSGRQVLPSN